MMMRCQKSLKMAFQTDKRESFLFSNKTFALDSNLIESYILYGVCNTAITVGTTILVGKEAKYRIVSAKISAFLHEKPIMQVLC